MPSGYDHSPTTDEGLERCVHCGDPFGGWNAGVETNARSGPVVSASSGVEYAAVIETEPGTVLMHPDCYKEHLAAVHAEENESLDAFVGGGP